MSFVGVALDGSEDEFTDFIVEYGVTSVPHISPDTHGPEVGELLTTYNVNSVPTFVVIQGGGEFRQRAGWSESQFRDDLAWLENA